MTSAPMGQVNSVNTNYHSDRSDHSDHSINTDNRDQSTKTVNSNNVTNTTIVYNNGASAPELSNEEKRIAYQYERKDLERRLKKFVDLDQFYDQMRRIDEDEHTGKIDRMEANIRRDMVATYKDSFQSCPQQTASQRPQFRPASAPVQTSTATPKTISADTASQVVNRVDPPKGNTPTGGTSEPGGNATLGYIIIAAVVVGICFWLFRSCGGSSESNESHTDTVVVTVQAEPETTPQSSSTSSAPRRTTVQQTSQQTTATQQSAPQQSAPQQTSSSHSEGNGYSVNLPQKQNDAPAQSQASSSPAPASSSASASDLVAAGKKAVRSFNYSSALQSFTQAANMGSSEANYQLGLLYNNSNFDGRNVNTAINYMTKAANAGSVDAMYQLGRMYMGRDNNSARTWMQKAASAGHAGAQSALNSL